jgi:26S proteasome non-ATPase regulatory subunit 9
MGIRMDDLHAPTVSSGPTSSSYSNGVSKDQLSLQELIAEKDRVETELKALGQVLDSVCMPPVVKELTLMRACSTVSI